MDLLEKYKKFVELADSALKIRDLPDISFRTKYDMVFSKEFQQAVKETEIRLEFYDSDRDYEHDVRAYVSALNDRAKEFRSLANVEIEI